jgi:hypothetical protein
VNITIQPLPGQRSRVLVDGVQWGTIDKTPHGPRGYSVVVRDLTGRSVSEPVYSAKEANRRARQDGQPMAPAFQTRLLDAVHRAIKDERLVHPDICAQRDADKQAKRDAWQADRNRNKARSIRGQGARSAGRRPDHHRGSAIDDRSHRRSDAVGRKLLGGLINELKQRRKSSAVSQAKRRKSSAVSQATR